MKTRYYSSIRVARLAALAITLPIQMLPIAEGATVPQDIEAEDIKHLDIRFLKNGVSGLGTKLGTEGDARYELDGSSITIYLPEQSRDFTLTIKGTYGEIGLNAVIAAAIATDADEEITLNTYIFDAIAAGGGGGADYKTDIYMDGAGRVILERFEDGSTLLLDEHENPIVKRNADGSTQFFDAYQSARLLMDAHGEVSLNDPTAGTLAIAEAIMARTRKHILTNAVGETTIKDEEGNVLTHADIYAMLMESPDFVVLVRADHAFHPNLVTETQIAFTCSYLGADGQISAERVNITSANVVTYSQGKGVMVSEAGAIIGSGFSIDKNNGLYFPPFHKFNPLMVSGSGYYLAKDAVSGEGWTLKGSGLTCSGVSLSGNAFRMGSNFSVVSGQVSGSGYFLSGGGFVIGSMTLTEADIQKLHNL